MESTSHCIAAVLLRLSPRVPGFGSSSSNMPQQQTGADNPDRRFGEYGSVEPFPIRRRILVSRPLRDFLSREALVSFDPSSVKIAPVCNPTDRSSVMSVQVTPLRQRMIDDMAIRNMSPLTQKAYVRAVKNFSLHFRRSPDALTFEDVRINYIWSRPAGRPRRSTRLWARCGSCMARHLARKTLPKRSSSRGSPIRSLSFFRVMRSLSS